MTSSRSIRLLAHNVRSLWNVGAFFRTCDALAIEKLYLTGYTGIPPRKEITKTALGADATVPWEQANDPLPALQQLRDDGWELIALELSDDAQALTDYHPGERTCIVVGHELDGVPERLRTLCHRTVMIPMLGTKESLNVAVAAGIALWHVRSAR